VSNYPDEWTEERKVEEWIEAKRHEVAVLKFEHRANEAGALMVLICEAEQVLANFRANRAAGRENAR
jgi:hypothetical protein